MTVLSAVQRGALGLATTDSPTFAGLSIDTNAGVDGQWNTSGLTVYANGVTPQHDGPLHVMSGSAGTVTAGNSYDELIVEGAGNTGISVLAPDASQVGFSLGSPTNKTGAELNWTYNNLAYNIGTNVANATINFYPDNYGHRGQWNTTGLTVFSSGTTPQHDGPLHVMAGSAGSITANPAGKTLVVEGDTAAGVGISILSADQGYLLFGHPTSGSFGAYIGYTGVAAGTSTLTFGTTYGVSSVVKFSVGDGSVQGEWSKTGLTATASGVTPQHDGVLHVMGGSAGAVTASTSANELILEGDTQTGMSILCPDANNGILYFGNTSNSSACQLIWDYDGNTNGELSLGTNKTGARIKFITGNSVEALTLNSSQQALFSAGSAAAPSVALNDGAVGAATGMYFTNAGGVTRTRFSVNGKNVLSLLYNNSATNQQIEFNTGVANAETAAGIYISNNTGTLGYLGKSMTRTGVTTGAVEILDIGQDRNAGMVLVHGSSSSTVYFSDLIHFNNGSTVVNAKGTGTPAARTYSLTSQGHINLAMASGTYAIMVNSITASSYN